MIELGIDTTHEFYLATQLVWDTPETYVAFAMHYVNTIYRGDVGAVFQVTGVRVHQGTGDPYADSNDSETYLQRARELVLTAAFPPSLQNADLIHVLHRNNTALGGVAYLDTLCDPDGYKVAFSDLLIDATQVSTQGYSWDVDVICHELGHNIGSVHTHCYVPPID